MAEAMIDAYTMHGNPFTTKVITEILNKPKLNQSEMTALGELTDSTYWGKEDETPFFERTEPRGRSPHRYRFNPPGS